MTHATPKTMKTTTLTRFGGLETINLQTLPVPEVSSDEVLIRVENAGVAVWDVLEREGSFHKMFGIDDENGSCRRFLSLATPTGWPESLETGSTPAAQCLLILEVDFS